MRDRYERRPRGHSFGATYNGITADNRPILELVPETWTKHRELFAMLKEKTGGRSGASISACLRSLRRHGWLDYKQDRQAGTEAEWRRVDCPPEAQS